MPPRCSHDVHNAAATAPALQCKYHENIHSQRRERKTSTELILSIEKSAIRPETKGEGLELFTTPACACRPTKTGGSVFDPDVYDHLRLKFIPSETIQGHGNNNT